MRGRRPLGRSARLLLAAAVAAGAWGARTAADAPVDIYVEELAAGAFHTCAGVGIWPYEGLTVYCWGANDSGQLGNGSTVQSHVPLPTQPAVDFYGGPQMIAAGAFHSCVLAWSMVEGPVHACWGYNGYGQLGTGAIDDRHAPAPVVNLTPRLAAPLGAGAFHTCATRGTALLRDDVWCWGANGSGQLGNDSTLQSDLPIPVPGLTGWIIAGSAYAPPGDESPSVVGASHTCVGDSSQGVRCWGANDHGQLGDGTTVDSHVPVPVSGLTGADVVGVTDVAAGAYHTCALTADAGTGIVSVKCWGRNDHGQLGNGTTVDSAVPVPVPGTASARAVVAGAHHTCAIVDTGTGSTGVKCWGLNNHGQLGNGTMVDSLLPATVPGMSSPEVIAAGAHHTCSAGFDEPNNVYCWGANGRGQLGNDSTADSPVPARVTFAPAPSWIWNPLWLDGAPAASTSRPAPTPPPPVPSPASCDLWGQSCSPVVTCCPGLDCFPLPHEGISVCCRGFDHQYDKCL